MIENNEGLRAAMDRFQELQQMRKKIHSDPKLNHRQKVSELAGIRALIEEIEGDIRQFHHLNRELFARLRVYELLVLQNSTLFKKF
jgi:hypothetical protein